jgi:hypothetical protein
MVVEDLLDRDVIERFERSHKNTYARLFLRAGLNPSRSLSNMLAGRTPWARDTRAGLFRHKFDVIERPRPENRKPAAIAPFEVLATTRSEAFLGGAAKGACVGGGAAAAFRFSPRWQMVTDVSGCKMTSFGSNWSGDSLTYLVGPRWTAAPLSKWEPWAQVLVGGRTLTHELMDPAKKAQLEQIAAQQGRELSYPDHNLYTTQSEITGVAISVHGGVDVKLSPAIALRVADAGFTRSWHANLDGLSYTDAVGLTSGLIVRFGTW